MNKIRKNDEVIVLTGRDKGKRGVVLQRLENDLVLVEGVNVAKKHVRPNPMKGIQGGIVDLTLPIHISNVALYDAKAGSASRVSVRVENGETLRFFKKSGETVRA